MKITLEEFKHIITKELLEHKPSNLKEQNMVLEIAYHKIITLDYDKIMMDNLSLNEEINELQSLLVTKG
jgi:hypothetical protein